MSDGDASKHLRTDHLDADLARRSARGGVVSVVAQLVKAAVMVGAMAVLGRLLRPEDFGLMAMTIAAVAVLGRLKDAGLFTAMVQRAHLTQDQASTLFWVNTAVCVAVAGAIVALAPAISWFYGEPRVLGIAVALAVMPLADGLAAQAEAVLTRQMRFTRLAAIDTVSLTAGFATALTLAWWGAGYWALASQEIVYSVANAILVWMTCKWRPGRPVRGSGVRPMIGFGLNLSGFKVLNYLAMNLDTVFVGRFWGAYQSGIYDRSYRLLMIPFQTLNAPLSSVAIPTLSRLQDDPERYRLYYRTGVQLAFALSMPLIAFLFVDAERAIVTILGSQWLGMVPVYRVLAPAAFLGKFNIVTNWVYVSTGRADRQLRWSAFTLIPIVAAYAIGVRWGAIGVAAAHTIVTVGLRYPSIVYCFKTAPVRVRDVLDVLWMPALASVGAGAALWALSAILPAPANVAVALVLDLVLYGLIYVTIWAAVPSGRDTVRDLIGLVLDAMPGGPNTWLRRKASVPDTADGV
jgi:O-antigen/teichoic acid export membrane protein